MDAPAIEWIADNGYLGHWRLQSRWPELARCWKRFGGDATLLAEAAPDAQAERLIETRLYPRHADYRADAEQTGQRGPYPPQQAALARLAKDREPLAESVLDAVHEYFLEHDAHYVADEIWTDDGEANLALMKDRRHTCEMLQLETIYVHNKWRQELSYIGLSFSSGWDDGHGIGVLLHGQRVLKVGGEDTAFNPSMWGDEAVLEKDKD